MRPIKNKKGFNWTQIATAIVVIIAVFIVLAIFKGIAQASGESLWEKTKNFGKQLMNIKIDETGVTGISGTNGGSTPTTQTTLTVKTVAEWQNVQPEEVKVGTTTFYFKTQKDGNFYVATSLPFPDWSRATHFIAKDQEVCGGTSGPQLNLCIKPISITSTTATIEASQYYTPVSEVLTAPNTYRIKKDLLYQLQSRTGLHHIRYITDAGTQVDFRVMYQGRTLDCTALLGGNEMTLTVGGASECCAARPNDVCGKALVKKLDTVEFQVCSQESC